MLKQERAAFISKRLNEIYPETPVRSRTAEPKSFLGIGSRSEPLCNSSFVITGLNLVMTFAFFQIYFWLMPMAKVKG